MVTVIIIPRLYNASLYFMIYIVTTSSLYQPRHNCPPRAIKLHTNTFLRLSHTHAGLGGASTCAPCSSSVGVRASLSWLCPKVSQEEGDVAEEEPRGTWPLKSRYQIYVGMVHWCCSRRKRRDFKLSRLEFSSAFCHYYFCWCYLGRDRRDVSYWGCYFHRPSATTSALLLVLFKEGKERC